MGRSFQLTIFWTIACVKLINSLPLGVDQTAILTPFGNLGEVTHNKIAQNLQSKVVNFVPPFPDSGRTRAVIEYESFPSQLDTKYGRLQDFAAAIFNPRPVVDSIQEHEKYGNDGGKSRAVSTSVVAGIEAGSNILNAAIDTPFELFTQTGKKISASLNTVGGKLVGLS